MFILQNVETYMSQIGQVIKMEIEESKCVLVNYYVEHAMTFATQITIKRYNY